MKKKTAIATTIVALSAMLLTACPGQTQEDYKVVGEYLTGKAAKKEYNAYMGTAPKDLDARKSQSGDVITHVANFEDCLLMNDGYGILRKSLAATAKRNADDTGVVAFNNIHILQSVFCKRKRINSLAVSRYASFSRFARAY